MAVPVTGKLHHGSLNKHGMQSATAEGRLCCHRAGHRSRVVHCACQASTCQHGGVGGEAVGGEETTAAAAAVGGGGHLHHLGGGGGGGTADDQPQHHSSNILLSCSIKAHGASMIQSDDSVVLQGAIWGVSGEGALLGKSLLSC